AAIAEDLGVQVTVLVRTPQQLARLIETNPFVAAGVDPKVLHVTFLAKTAARGDVAKLDGSAFAPDEFRIDGTEVFLACPNGYGRTKINNTWFEDRKSTRLSSSHRTIS